MPLLLMAQLRPLRHRLHRRLSSGHAVAAEPGGGAVYATEDTTTAAAAAAIGGKYCR